MANGRGRHVVLVVVLVAVAAAVVGLAIAQDQETLRLRSAHAAGEPVTPAYLASLVGGELTHGNRYDVLTNGDQVFPAMLEAINRAERRISFETYVYDEGALAETFTTALESAARRGVQVDIVLDEIGASSMDPAHDERLRKAGCRIVSLNAPRWYELEELNYRTHRKIMVVDGQVGFTGGVGVADQWLGHAQDKDHWRDTHIRVRGPIVQFLEGTFYENFAESGTIVTPVLDRVPDEAGDEHPTEPGDEHQGSSILLRSAPTGGSSDLKRLYLLAIAMARRSIDIASPYFITDESTMWALEDAVGRGIKIRIMMESDITDAKPVKYASRAAFERLLSRGIELHEYLPTMMHAKVLVVDGVWSVFGSANFDNRSFELNDELNIAVMSPELAGRFLSDFDQDLRASRKLELDSWRNRPFLEKAREHFWSYFGEVF
jgi:cardiolipin synthase